MSLLIKALKQAERSHKQSSDLLDDDQGRGSDDRRTLASQAEETSNRPGTLKPGADSALQFTLDSGAASHAESGDSPPRGSESGQKGARGLTTAQPSWSTMLDGGDRSLPRAATDAKAASPETGQHNGPAAAALTLAPAGDDAPNEELADPYPPVPAPTDAAGADDTLGLMEMGSLEPEPAGAFPAPDPEPASADTEEVIALAPSDPDPRERPALEFADVASDESVTDGTQAPAPISSYVEADTASVDTQQPDYETAAVVEPAGSRSRRVKPAVVAGIVGVIAGGWFGYQAFVTPELDFTPASEPMMPVPASEPLMPMPAIATTPAMTTDGPLWTTAELAILDEVTRHGRMIAEGGWIAVAPQDGRVPAAPALPRASAPAKKPAVASTPAAEAPVAGATPSVARITPPVARATPEVARATPQVDRATPPVALATAPATAAPGVPAVPVPQGTPASGSASESADPATPQAPPAGAQAVRLKRAMSAAERSALVKTAAYRALRMNRLDDAERLYRDALVRNPLDSDAWIGLASIAAQQGDTTLARQQYERALTIDPNDAVAQAGLLSVTRSEEPSRRESRLRNLIASGMNSAGVTFELANALAEQDRWLEAQQAYFEASSAEPANADYAFNLAVALDRLAQHGVAIQHYRRAIALADSGPASFDPAQAHQRVQALETATAER